jgi:hypothetical protein
MQTACASVPATLSAQARGGRFMKHIIILALSLILFIVAYNILGLDIEYLVYAIFFIIALVLGMFVRSAWREDD